MAFLRRCIMPCLSHSTILFSIYFSGQDRQGGGSFAAYMFVPYPPNQYICLPSHSKCQSWEGEGTGRGFAQTYILYKFQKSRWENAGHLVLTLETKCLVGVYSIAFHLSGNQPHSLPFIAPAILSGNSQVRIKTDSYCKCPRKDPLV